MKILCLGVLLIISTVTADWLDIEGDGGYKDEDDDHDDDDTDDEYRGRENVRHGGHHAVGPHGHGNMNEMGPMGLMKIMDHLDYGYKGKYMGKGMGANPFMAEALTGNRHNYVGGGNLHMAHGGVKSPLNFITNAAYQGNFLPMKNFGYGGFGGLDNAGAHMINEKRKEEGLPDLDPDDLDDDGEPDHLTAVKHKIDDFIAKQWKLGKRKLTVQVHYGNIPLEYQYLNQFHGFPIPIQGTALGGRVGLSPAANYFNDPMKGGMKAYSHYDKAPTGPPPGFDMSMMGGESAGFDMQGSDSLLQQQGGFQGQPMQGMSEQIDQGQHGGQAPEEEEYVPPELLRQDAAAGQQPTGGMQGAGQPGGMTGQQPAGQFGGMAGGNHPGAGNQFGGMQGGGQPGQFGGLPGGNQFGGMQGGGQPSQFGNQFGGMAGGLPGGQFNGMQFGGGQMGGGGFMQGMTTRK